MKVKQRECNELLLHALHQIPQDITTLVCILIFIYAGDETHCGEGGKLVVQPAFYLIQLELKRRPYMGRFHIINTPCKLLQQMKHLRLSILMY